MKITFLGTGSIATKSNCSSFLLNNNILVDVGFGSTRALTECGFDTKYINTIIITHFHNDHMGDIAHFLCRRFAKAKTHPLTIIGPIGLMDKIRGYYSPIQEPGEPELLFFRMEDVTVIELKPHESFKNETIHVRSFPVVHYSYYFNKPDNRCYGYVIELNGEKLGVSGDTCLCPELEKNIPDADTWLMDCALLNEKEGNNRHMSLDEVNKLAKQYPDKKFYTVHRRDWEIPTHHADNLFFPVDGDILEKKSNNPNHN